MAEADDITQMLTCPETGQRLEPLDDERLSRLNEAIRDGSLVDDSGQRVERTLQGALVREDGQVAYAVHDDIPNLLLEDRIRLGQI
ncbi:MAG: hypothetical protein ACOCV2_11540 [Persicimonas sp.]